MNDDNYNQEVYIIPTNISDNGDLFGGYIKLRNFCETIFVALVMFIIWKFIFAFFSLKVKAISFFILIVPISCLTLIGIKNESFFEWLIEIINFKRRKRVIMFKIPREIKEKTKLFASKK